MWRPSSNASAILIADPGTSGLVLRHVARCSSDRKKLSVVQSESQALRSSSARLPTQTMTSAACGAGPDG